MKVLLIGEIHPDAAQALERGTTLTKITNTAFLAQGQFPEVEAVVLRTYTPLTKKELDKLPSLKYVVSCSVGLDNMDLQELRRRGINLIHSPGSNANSVAEHVIYLLMSLLRSRAPFPELKWKTVGIIGFGYIGKLVARKLRGMECTVIAYDTVIPTAEITQELSVQMMGLQEVLALADIITVHVPLNVHTKGMLGENEFQCMKEGAFFINTSRAEIVDENALLLHGKKLRGIGLDVYSEELRERMKQYVNVIFTEHKGAQGEESFREMCCQPVHEFLKRVERGG